MKQVLIQAVPDQAERGEAQPVAARHLGGRVKDLAESGLAIGRRRREPGAPAHDRHGGEHDQRRLAHPHRVERERIHLGEGRLDDDVVGAPDDGHQEQEGVEGRDAGHFVDVKITEENGGNGF